MTDQTPADSLTLDQARELLAVHDNRVHTFRGGGPILLGADWDLADVERCIEEHGVAPAGPFMSAMHHALVSTDDTGPVFFATARLDFDFERDLNETGGPS